MADNNNFSAAGCCLLLLPQTTDDDGGGPGGTKHPSTGYTRITSRPAAPRTTSVGVTKGSPLASTILLLLLYSSIPLGVAWGSSECPEPCVCLGAIVDCSRADLQAVPPHLPDWTEELDLSRNPGLDIVPGALSELPSLKTLTLANLNLEELPSLGHLPSLTALSLSGNMISDLRRVSLDGLPALRTLDLSRNLLDTLDQIPFRNTDIFSLNLSRNKLSLLSVESFRYLSSLVELKLSRNLLTDSAFLPGQPVFANLTNLRSLDLNGNKITKVHGLMFKDLGKLQTLKLKRNQITTLSDGAFFGLNSISTLSLDFNNITMVSNEWLFGLKSLKTLTLSNNQIDSVRPKSWVETSLLTNLDISHNRLVSIRISTFRGLGELSNLKVANNYLAHMEREAFGLNTNLASLDLSHNELRWSVEDSSGAFTGLPVLRNLNLAYNNIETVHVDAFRPMSQLQELNLRGNQLRTLSDNPFEDLHSLKTLVVNTSSLVCDCNLGWLPAWLAHRGHNTSQFSATCTYPTNLRGKLIGVLSSSDLTCDSSPRPMIQQSPGDQIVLHGEDVTLACVAHADFEGDAPVFMWRKDTTTLEPFRIKTLVNVIGGDGTGGAIHNVTSLLNLHNVTDDDSGNYQCVVRNQFGASYSKRAHIQVHVFPYFTKTPSNVEIRVGEVAKIECPAGGSPMPEISLAKEGANDFPAARERRLHVIPTDNIFYIKPVKAYDEGRYTCKATNPAGTASTDAYVTVRQTPQFSKSLTDKTVRTGDTAVLECQGSGQPQPKVSWQKNGASLNESKRYVFVQENQYLLILEAEAMDGGTYTCQLTNILGTVREDVHLSVRTVMFGENTTTTTGIVMMAVVCCVVFTSLVWVVIIHQTRKRARGANNSCHNHHHSSFPPEDGLPHYPTHIHHHITPDLIHKFPPLLGNNQENYSGGQDSGSEHSSGKDSGTGDSAQRSNEDLLPLELSHAGIRRSLIICADNGSPPTILRGHSSASVGGDGDLTGCEVEIIRPRLSTFGPRDHLSPGHGNGGVPGVHTASLRRGSSSRLTPVAAPISPVATLPRKPHPPYLERSPRGSPCSSPGHKPSSPSHQRSLSYMSGNITSHPIPSHSQRASSYMPDSDTIDTTNEEEKQFIPKNIEPLENGSAVNNISVNNAVNNGDMYGDTDSRADLDLRIENEVTPLNPRNSIPSIITLKAR